MTDQRPLLPVTQSDRDAALACCNEALRNVHPRAASDVDFTAMAEHFAAYRHRLTAEQDGWVRVPVEPTEEMIEAGEEAPLNMDRDVGRNAALRVWSAMIAAAPPANILDSTKEAGHGRG